MSKKLPGLKRRAPEIDEGAPAPAPKAAAKAKRQAPKRAATKAASSKAKAPQPKAARPRRVAREQVAEPSAFDGDRKIDAEVLAPEGSKAASTEQIEKAMAIVRRRSNWATVGGLIPIPLVDSAIIAGVQIEMLSDLSELYGVPFQRNRAKSIVLSLIGGIMSYAAGAGVFGLLGKSLPVIGWGFGLATVTVLARASTQAAGILFIQHFESGGTLFDFDAAEMREFYRREFDTARRQATT